MRFYAGGSAVGVHPRTGAGATRISRGGNSVRELHRTLKDSSLLYFFYQAHFRKACRFVLFFSPICLSLLSVVYAKQFYAAAILKQHTTSQNISLPRLPNGKKCFGRQSCPR